MEGRKVFLLEPNSSEGLPKYLTWAIDEKTARSSIILTLAKKLDEYENVKCDNFVEEIYQDKHKTLCRELKENQDYIKVEEDAQDIHIKMLPDNKNYYLSADSKVRLDEKNKSRRRKN